jgi:hypothetical protein
MTMKTYRVGGTGFWDGTTLWPRGSVIEWDGPGGESLEELDVPAKSGPPVSRASLVENYRPKKVPATPGPVPVPFTEGKKAEPDLTPAEQAKPKSETGWPMPDEEGDATDDDGEPTKRGPGRPRKV